MSGDRGYHYDGRHRDGHRRSGHAQSVIPARLADIVSSASDNILAEISGQGLIADVFAKIADVSGRLLGQSGREMGSEVLAAVGQVGLADQQGLCGFGVEAADWLFVHCRGERSE